jgi:hypothetical protein
MVSVMDLHIAAAVVSSSMPPSPPPLSAPRFPAEVCAWRGVLLVQAFPGSCTPVGELRPVTASLSATH